MDISITVNGLVTTLKIENTSIIDSFSQSDLDNYTYNNHYFKFSGFGRLI